MAQRYAAVESSTVASYLKIDTYRADNEILLHGLAIEAI